MTESHAVTEAPRPREVTLSTGYSINTTWYLDVNTLAKDSSWAHGVMAFYSHFFGLGLLALLLLVAWWVARSDRFPARAVATVLWAAGGTVAAWVVAHFVLKPVVAERRPYLVLSHVEVLLARTHGYSFPSGHATIAGAVIVGLWMARRWIIASIASVLGLLLAFGRVYTGMHYPFDVVAGLAFGGAFVALLWAVCVAALTHWNRLLLTSPFASLVAAGGGRATAGGRVGGRGAHALADTDARAGFPRPAERPKRAVEALPPDDRRSPGA